MPSPTWWAARLSRRACRCCVRAAGRPRSRRSEAISIAIDRNLTLHRVLVRPDGARLAELGSLLESGRLTTSIRGTYPLADAAAAHAEVLRGGAPGKTVITVADGKLSD